MVHRPFEAAMQEAAHAYLRASHQLLHGEISREHYIAVRDGWRMAYHVFQLVNFGTATAGATNVVPFDPNRRRANRSRSGTFVPPQGPSAA